MSLAAYASETNKDAKKKKSLKKKPWSNCMS